MSVSPCHLRECSSRGFFLDDLLRFLGSSETILPHARAYCGFILFFLVRILRRLRRDFRSAVTADNFILLVTFVLLIGIAQFSGAVLRRPNVSFYLSLILGLIYFQTDPDPAKQIGSWRGEWI